MRIKFGKSAFKSISFLRSIEDLFEISLSESSTEKMLKKIEKYRNNLLKERKHKTDKVLRAPFTMFWNNLLSFPAEYDIEEDL